uniref:Uncharacterized protein n=1 Tax=Falco tinnunculus TaxID=100819 RepID=A0A8C4V7W5_FALTI
AARSRARRAAPGRGGSTRCTAAGTAAGPAPGAAPPRPHASRTGYRLRAARPCGSCRARRGASLPPGSPALPPGLPPPPRAGAAPPVPSGTPQPFYTLPGPQPSPAGCRVRGRPHPPSVKMSVLSPARSLPAGADPRHLHSLASGLGLCSLLASNVPCHCLHPYKQRGAPWGGAGHRATPLAWTGKKKGAGIPLRAELAHS